MNCNYKIQTLNGFKMYFDQVISVFKARYEEDDKFDLDLLVERSGFNRRKARLILNFLADLGLSQKGSLNKTTLGQIIYEYDDFLEDNGTLWLLHYLQGSNSYIITWNRVLNYLYQENSVNKKCLVDLFTDLKDQLSEYTYKHHIGKEIRIMLDAYTNQKFNQLYILEKEGEEYIINKNNDIPQLIILAAMKRYQELYYPGATAVDIKELATAYNSPGRIFLLDEYVFRKHLESMKQQGYIGLETRADLDQVRFKDEIDFEGIIELYYRGE